MTTFRDLLATRLRHRPGDPLVTFYDEATGERTELSVTTYANWVAKTASLLLDELGLERGDRLLVDLPAHWLGPVVLGSAWTAGLEVVWEGDPAVLQRSTVTDTQTGLVYKAADPALGARGIAVTVTAETRSFIWTFQP